MTRRQFPPLESFLPEPPGVFFEFKGQDMSTNEERARWLYDNLVIDRMIMGAERRDDYSRKGNAFAHMASHDPADGWLGLCLAHVQGKPFGAHVMFIDAQTEGDVVANVLGSYYGGSLVNNMTRLVALDYDVPADAVRVMPAYQEALPEFRFFTSNENKWHAYGLLDEPIDARIAKRWLRGIVNSLPTIKGVEVFPKTADHGLSRLSCYLKFPFDGGKYLQPMDDLSPLVPIPVSRMKQAKEWFASGVTSSGLTTTTQARPTKKTTPPRSDGTPPFGMSQSHWDKYRFKNDDRSRDGTRSWKFHLFSWNCGLSHEAASKFFGERFPSMSIPTLPQFDKARRLLNDRHSRTGKFDLGWQVENAKRTAPSGSLEENWIFRLRNKVWSPRHGLGPLSKDLFHWFCLRANSRGCLGSGCFDKPECRIPLKEFLSPGRPYAGLMLPRLKLQAAGLIRLSVNPVKYQSRGYQVMLPSKEQEATILSRVVWIKTARGSESWKDSQEEFNALTKVLDERFSLSHKGIDKHEG